MDGMLTVVRKTLEENRAYIAVMMSKRSKKEAKIST